MGINDLILPFTITRRKQNKSPTSGGIRTRAPPVVRRTTPPPALLGVTVKSGQNRRSQSATRRVCASGGDSAPPSSSPAGRPELQKKPRQSESSKMYGRRRVSTRTQFSTVESTRSSDVNSRMIVY